jgi:cytochrome c oxidase subunit II
MSDLRLSIPTASIMAGHVDVLFYSLLALTSVVALGVFIAMAWWAYKYRRNSNADRSHPPARKRIVEYTYILIPLMIFLGMYFWGAVQYDHEYTPQKNAEVIYVVAKQWMWKLQHPDGRREINELHIPVGVPIKLIMTSQDVIHSFFLPAFRLKHDVLPDRYVALSFTADKPGDYLLECAEFCGANHSQMTGHVIVMTAAEYAAWQRSGPVNTSLAARGKALFTQFGCAGCHGPGSTVHAPDLAGLYGKPVTLANGTMVTADERFLHDHILFPNQTLPAGYPPIMPSFAGQISEDDLAALVDYIKTMQPQRGTP